MTNLLNLAHHAAGQQRPQIVHGEVAAPAPASFTAPLYVIAPEWRRDVYWAIFPHWPKSHGNTLPAVGSSVTMLLGSNNAYRCVEWDGPNT